MRKRKLNIQYSHSNKRNNEFANHTYTVHTLTYSANAQINYRLLQTFLILETFLILIFYFHMCIFGGKKCIHNFLMVARCCCDCCCCIASMILYAYVCVDCLILNVAFYGKWMKNTCIFLLYWSNCSPPAPQIFHIDTHTHAEKKAWSKFNSTKSY